MEYESSPQQAGESEKKSLVVGNGSTEESPPPMPEDNAAVTGRKKGKKEGEDDDDVVFSGKKKKGGGGGVGRRSVFTASSFGLLGDDEMSGFSGKEEVEEEDVSLVAFSGKKKKSSRKSSSSSVAANVSDETGFGSESVDDVVVVEHEELPGLEVSNTTVAVADNNNVSSRSEEEVTAISKNKRKNKKKKSVRTAQEEEEEDLDKILAELGEGPTIAKPDDAPPPPPQDDDDVNAALGEKEGEDETVESAAAAANKKKKKKKKEKEKEKKVAAISAAAAAGSALENETREEVKAAEPIESKKNGSFTKAAGEKKKVPKHVREMQEALARRKEEEERKKREEEERLMKEEDERRRHEELERQAEEARRRKKEKEKEKLQRKKQEGKLLTFKQKEEARRLEIMRKQFLNNSTCDVMILPTALGKRPIYRAKKPKPAHHHQESGAAAAVETAESVEETKGNQEMTTTNAADPEQVEDEEVEEKVELLLEAGGEDGNGVEEEDDLEEDEWDAKSWDDDDVILNAKGAFADEEEVDSEPESVVKQETKTTAVTAAHSAATTMKTVSKSMTRETENRNQATDKNRKPNPDSKREPPEYAVPREPPKSMLPKETPKSTVPPKILSVGNLRSPICCIMGHVDAGKTKLLDCIRGTNVQEGEAGGITQQIGATYFPAENIRERTKELKADAKLEVPGLLVIDTPGHKPFTKLRSRGSGLCDIVILVVDITRGLKQRTTEKTTKKTTAKTIEETTEETTTELLNLLKNRNTEFIIALNKVDRLYGWKTCRNSPIVKAMKQQTKNVQIEFNMKVTQIIAQFKEHGLNTALYYKNKEMGETFSIVPTSAISGEGIPDLLLLLVQWTQKTMVGKLTYSEEVKCTVLEVKVLEGHGTTLDVVLVNGVLHEGDQIVVCGMQGPIVTTIRALLTPHPMKELRVKGTYLHHEEIKAAMGIKISARGLEHAIAGTDLYVVKVDDDLEDVKEVAMEDMRSVMNKIDTSGVGVCVQASTLGSLEALLELLKSEVKVPVSAISIGPVHKKDVMKASIMLAKNRKYAAILAFDVKVTPEARELADELGVNFFIADVFYQLSDQFKAYIESINAEEKREAADQTVFPCVLKILPDCIFNKKDPIVLGVDVLEGIAKVGTPICIPSREFVDIGRIVSIQYNHKPVDSAKKGQQIAIKIVGSHPEEQHKMYGRHFDNGDELVSRISERYTPDRADMTKDEWNLLMKLKNVFKIQRGGLI